MLSFEERKERIFLVPSVRGYMKLHLRRPLVRPNRLSSAHPDLPGGKATNTPALLIQPSLLVRIFLKPLRRYYKEGLAVCNTGINAGVKLKWHSHNVQ
jgi:hypothetical protein